MSEDWKAFLKPEEAAELQAMEAASRENAAKRRRIYYRCKKRQAKARGASNGDR